MDVSELLELQETLDSVIVGFLAVVRNRLDAPRYGESQLFGDAAITQQARGVFEGLSLQGVRDPDVPRDELNRFILPTQRARARGLTRAQRAHQTLYGPLGLGDTLRMLVFDGALCVGWFGAVRWVDAPAFEGEELQLVRGVEQRWVDYFTAEHRKKSNILDGAEAHLVCDLSGRVVAHSRHVGRWLTRERLRRIREVVRGSCRRGSFGKETNRAVIGDYAWRVARLEGPSGNLVYLNAPLGSFGAANLSVLSVRQHEVVKLFALGLSTKEVAEELSLSPHTIKQHLSTAYRLLGVARREQLIERLHVAS